MAVFLVFQEKVIIFAAETIKPTRVARFYANYGERQTCEGVALFFYP